MSNLPECTNAVNNTRTCILNHLKFTNYMTDLNQEQRLAVETTEGPLLVLAGAGTGKTRVLTSRVAHILSAGKAQPREIFTATFTNKAAKEMKTRIWNKIGTLADEIPWLGTFHSLGARILRRNAELVGLRPDFAILSTDDQLRILKQLIKSVNLDTNRWSARLLANIINGWKNKGLEVEQVPESEEHEFANLGKHLYAEYQTTLKELNSVDYGDLLSRVFQLWRRHADVLEYYRSRFRYLLVDEYQDTNVVQYLWLKLLAMPSGNIACVGDDDQSIYGWRGAEISNILGFEQAFPGAQVIRLERNYRSTNHILTTASHLISHNSTRLRKTLFAEESSESDCRVIISNAFDSEDEAMLIGKEAVQLRDEGHLLSQIAILVRASSQMREFEEVFTSISLPYHIVGGPRFYDRAEIRDALAYFRCATRLSDNLAFERIFNTPKRGLGKVTFQKLREIAQQKSVSTLEAASRIVNESSNGLSNKIRSALSELTSKAKRWNHLLPEMDCAKLAQLILDESGYLKMLKDEGTAESETRLENLKELVRSISEYDNLPNFLEHTALVTNPEGSQNDLRDAINIMTLHSSKGLEFETVFLPGWEDGILPHQRSLDEGRSSALEEERRLAYVGLTRARKKAVIYFASHRRTHGQWYHSTPSRFLSELPEEHISIVNHFSQKTWTETTEARKKNLESSNFVNKRSKSTINQIQRGQGTVKISATANTIKAGTDVYSKTFGYGIALAVTGKNLKVYFDSVGEKTIRSSYVEPILNSIESKKN